VLLPARKLQVAIHAIELYEKPVPCLLVDEQEFRRSSRGNLPDPLLGVLNSFG
jgi:hypothetical protein